MNISNETKQSSVRYVMDEIEYTCKHCGKRTPGSEGEKLAIDHMAKELEKHTDSVKIEPFDVYPNSFLGWIPITLILIIAGFAAYFFLPILTVVLASAGLILLVCRLLFYTEIIDKLFPKKISHNITAVKHPTGEVKRRIYFNGHSDAAWEWPLAYHLGGFMNSLIPIVACVGACATIFLAIIRMSVEGTMGVSIASGGFLWAGFSFFIFLPFYLLLFFFVDFKRTVPGANDNLTACYTAIAVIKAMEEAGVRLEHTEVGALITGSEEAGLRGSRAWAKKHKKECGEVETVVITMETLREPEFLSVFHRDLNGIFSSDEGVCELIMKAGEQCGVKIGKFSVTAGATDAMGFVLNGIKAACLGAVDHNLKLGYYHTRKDDYDNLSPECLSKALEVTLAAVEIFDKEGLSKL